ncbi:MAG: hypothetical protein M1378_01440 [Bacteroidetes bacterium]|nr:hypothetical protein [Bacteroidota bacterium]
MKPRQVTPPPSSFAANKNYPDPFSLSTQITNRLPVGASVTLRVRDAPGAEAETLVHRREAADTRII